ncbi:sulfite exporter TauE/SafE family protein [Sphingobium fluviale]|uniref:Probable membrane transporter protein n=1 Tax=Sphingobium fluviale TaxID=2506423 RepID=A0A4Q1KEL9_9SPHN|nr:sulfite exporter TauE/SafE family protein [Sphingobium fluviale]RXR24969.1 sulfite exporter TauE/SafE family protein [Sphingobium fluviale]
MDILSLHDVLLALLIAVGAALYSSVGHAGASAYIALMALFGVPSATMRPTALTLNVIVASLASARYLRAGLFRWRVLWPFLVTAVPMAFVGGTIILPSDIYRPLVGIVLWLSALRLLWPVQLRAEKEHRDPPIVLGLLAGAVIGLLSGLTGTGGGIFLSPILLFMQWSPVKPASGVAAVFILANSIAGLAGNLSAVQNLPAQLPLYAGAALAGGILGTTLGIRLNATILTRALGVVLVIAGAKMIGVY